MFKYLLTALLLAAGSIAQGQTYRIYFDTDKSTLRPDMMMLLDSLLQKGVFATSDSLTIACHCDSRADSAYNYALSVRRAQSVRSYLLARQINRPIIVRAFGEQQPIAPNTEAKRFENRRCDVVVYETKALPEPIAPQPKSPEQLKENEVLALEGLEFVGNQAVPYHYSMPVLYKLFAVMAQYPKLRIELLGHVCCGNDMPLSIARAKAVYDFLVDNGIDSTRLAYRGFSNTMPLVEEIDEASRQRNRRVEVRVVQAAESASVQTTVKPLPMVVGLREIPWDGRNNTPSSEGHHNLELLAKMIARSRGYEYKIMVYAARPGQVKERVTYLQQYFARKRATVNKLRIISGEELRYLRTDLLVLEITPKT